MKIDKRITPAHIESALDNFFTLAGNKIKRIEKTWDSTKGTPVFTVRGKYATRGWTEWTQGFQYGCQVLQYDATGDESFLGMGRENTRTHMAAHVTHIGVHDHGFNNLSTYGNLRRLAREGRSNDGPGDIDFYEMAIKASGAVQAARWTKLRDGSGYIHSFNGPHSLFSDTIRSCRILMVAHQLGHSLMGENDESFSLLGRALDHADNTAKYNVYYGKGRDRYDVRGRVVHESIFNVADGRYRCPSTQQGYAPFSTWTRGLAWILLGYAEELECFAAMPAAEFEAYGGRPKWNKLAREAACATSDFYIENTALDGIPYWDTGAPGLANMPEYRDELSMPDNSYEPVDSSAAAIAAQGLLRLGRVLGPQGKGKRYFQAGLTVARTLFSAPYLSESPAHQGLILHSIYHHPNGWDYVPRGKEIPQGESSMWGDYHAMELAVYLQRLIKKAPYLTFFDKTKG